MTRSSLTKNAKRKSALALFFDNLLKLLNEKRHLDFWMGHFSKINKRLILILMSHIFIRQHHSVWKSPKMSHLNFWILTFSANFCLIEIDLSGHTVWPKASGYQTLAIMDHFWHFPLIFVYSKRKRSSLRPLCWMRLFLWFSNTLQQCCNFETFLP